MDASRFDRLSRLLAMAPTRRTALTAVAALVSQILTSPVGDAHAAVCRPLSSRCFPGHGMECCQGTCQDGRCRCAPEQKRCRGRCIPRQQRYRRRRTTGCPPGKKRCAGRCIPRAACCRNRDCGAGRVCQGGACRHPAPPCPGCYAGETCVPGDSVEKCGGGGEACQTCGDGELCGGACGCMPDPSTCLPPGTVCPDGNDCSTCCSRTDYGCGLGVRCCGDATPGDACGPGVICTNQGSKTECRCNRCCALSGVKPFEIWGTGDCATDCCSGKCLPDTFICA